MIRAYVENGRLMALSIALLLVAGLGALHTLPRDEDPRIANRFAMIFTQLPGASAERVEALLSEPIESKLRELNEIKNITSNSRAGISIILIELKDEIKEKQTEMIWARSRSLLDEIEPKLPEGASKPQFNKDRTYAYTMIIALRSQNDAEPQLSVLNRYADELESSLRGLPGTDLVTLFGDIREEIQVSIDPLKAASAGLDIAGISQAIRGADAKVSAGQLNNDKHRYSVEVVGELNSAARIGAIPLGSNANNELIHISDIAQVSRQLQSPPDNMVITAGKPAVVVAVRMIASVRNDHWTAQVEQKLNEFNHSIPSNIKADIIFSQQKYTQERLSSLVGNIVLGFVLILAVLLFTLGWRSALIVASALPLTVLFTLTCMQYYGLPIHQMSVTGLVVALGIMVDNAIVMTDAIAQNRVQGMGRTEATTRAVKHLWLPLLGSTITTILGFLPIVLMPGPAGEFVGGIALSVIFSLIGSYLISHTIVAGLAGRFSQTHSASSTAWHVNGWQSEKISSLFRYVLSKSLDTPLRSAALVMVVPISGFIAAQQLTEQFFPPSDRDMINIELRLSYQNSIHATQGVTERISEVLNATQGIESVHWFIGKSAPSFYYNLRQNQDGSPNFAQAMVNTRHFSVANRLIPKLQKQLDEQFPEAQILVKKLEQGPPFNAPVELRIYGPNLDTLAMLGDEIRRIMSTTTNMMHTRATLSEAAPKIWLELDEEMSRLSGLSLQQLAEQTRNALDGSVQGSVLESTEDIPVRVRFDSGERQQLGDLNKLYFIPPKPLQADGFPGLPLSAIGELTVRPSHGVIPRRNGQRLNSIEGFIRADVLPAAVLSDVKVALKEQGFTLPSGYRLEFGGEGEKRDDAVGNLLAYIGMIVALLVLVIVLSFNSFRISFIIFAVAFQSAGLGLLSIYIFQYPFGFPVIISLLGLMGLAINAAIVILAELKANKQAVEGDKDAVICCVQSCARHISSTTITTIGGFLPLMLSGGGFWPPFAISIAGGTLLTTLLSFFFVPALFYWFARHKAFEVSSASVS